MKKNYWSVVIFFMVTLLPLSFLSCSSSSSGGGGNGSAPTLSNPIFPSTVHIGETYLISFDYSDPDGDIETVYYKDSWSGGSFVYPFTAEEVGISGTSGTVTIDYTILPGTIIGNHQVEVWVKDGEGHTSNTLSGNITVE